MGQLVKRLVVRALHPATALAAAGMVLVVFLAMQLVHSQQKPYVELYGQTVDGHTLHGRSCHDLAYPQIRCFDTSQEMFDDEIRMRPSRAALIQEPDKPAYVVYRGQHYPVSHMADFAACHALGFPEIRCFDSVRESLLDAIANFPESARTSRERLAALDGGTP